MANDEPDFVTWALDPARTVEEAFVAELLVEFALPAWRNKHKIPDPPGYDPYNYEAKRQHQRQRRLNPAHRTTLTEPDVLHAAEILPGLTSIRYWEGEYGRPVRDLSGLRFCPSLKCLHLAPAELHSLDGLCALPLLDDLWLQDDRIEDISALAGCPALKGIHLWLGYPWADLRALAELPALESLTLHGNLPMLRDVGPLSRLTKIGLHGFDHNRAPLRDAHDLPEMPVLREAYIAPWARLDGIAQRLPAVEELTVEGPFKSLAPLEGLAHLSKFTLAGSYFQDLAPLVRLPALSVLELIREEPIDLSPLLESNSLRELRPGYKRPMSPEMAGLNAALGGWENDFLLPEPRPLPAPVSRFTCHQGDPPPGHEPREGHRAEPLNEPLQEAEGRWVAGRFQRALDRLLGGKGWGETYSSDHDAHRCEVDVNLHTLEAVDRLEAIVDTLRHELAALRNRWVVMVNIDLMSTWQRDPEAWKDPVQRALEERIEEARDHAQRRREYLDFVNRLARLRLREEQGETPSPEEFAAPPPAEKEEDEDDDSDLLEADDEDGFREEKHPQWLTYYIRFKVCEEGCWFAAGFRKRLPLIWPHPVEKYPGWTYKDEASDDED